MTKVEMEFFNKRFDNFEEKLDTVINTVSDLKNEQKFCPAHNKPRLKNIIDNDEEKNNTNKGLKQIVLTGIFGLIFSAIGSVFTLIFTGKLKIF